MNNSIVSLILVPFRLRVTFFSCFLLFERCYFFYLDKSQMPAKPFLENLGLFKSQSYFKTGQNNNDKLSILYFHHR